MASLFLWTILALPQDPYGRLTEGIRETRTERVQTALQEIIAEDGPRAARALVAALSRCRDRQESLLSSTLAAREDHDRIESAFTITIEEERIQKKQLAAADTRIKEAHRKAAEGERVCEAVRQALAALGPQASETLAAEARRTPSWILKCQLYEALGARNDPAALETEQEPIVLATILNALPSDKAIDFLTHPQWQVRLAAIGALREVRSAVDRLIGLLGRQDARLRTAAADTLVRLTRTTLPPDPSIWKEWRRLHGEAFSDGRYLPEQGRDLRRTTFYDVPLPSTRLCFLVDRSSSMREQGRWDTATKELKRLLDLLPDSASVNVLFFGQGVSSFARTMRTLDRITRRDLARFIEQQGQDSTTDLYRGFEKALSLVGSPESGTLREEGPDTIVILSDGKATWGRLVDDELLGYVMARRARYLRPVVHSISLANEAKALRHIAEATGGTYSVK